MEHVLAGYAGGTLQNPTYMALGDHTEVIEIRFNPDKISFAQLVELFFTWHHPRPNMPTQYRSVILAGNQEQFEEASRLVDLQQRQTGAAAGVSVEMLDVFYEAEGYHQKYYLQSRRAAVERLDAFFGSRQQWFGEPVAALLNAVGAREITAQEALENAADRELDVSQQALLAELLDLF